LKKAPENTIASEGNGPRVKYSRREEVLHNLPYVAMILLGAAIFVAGLGMSLWGAIAAGLYVLCGLAGAFSIILFVCPYCACYGARTCPCGYGQIAAKLRTQGDETQFREKFKKHIPLIVPLWVMPVVAAGLFLVSAFSLWMLTLALLFAVVAFVVLPVMSKKRFCARCPQKDACPWEAERAAQERLPEGVGCRDCDPRENCRSIQRSDTGRPGEAREGNRTRELGPH
jgi:hypothetical protein